MRQFFQLTAAQSKVFLRYFNAALRDPRVGMIMGNGEASFKDGDYVIRQTTNFQYSGTAMYAIWRIILMEDGRLISIENENTVDDGGQYEILLHRFLNDVLQKVLANVTEKFFRRSYFLASSSCNLPGEYWLPGFRFAALLPEDDSHVINSERIVVIDQEVLAVDASHATEVAQEQADRFAAYLTFILDAALEKPRQEDKYVLVEQASGLTMERRRCGIVDASLPQRMPEKGSLCRLAEFRDSVFDKHRYLGEYLVCPVETRRILRGIQSMSDPDRSAITRCCMLYQLAQGIGRYHPTVRASYECAAIDARAAGRSKGREEFVQFMKRYDGTNEQLYGLMYGQVRSAHFHAGEFPLGELEYGHDLIGGPESFMSFNILMGAHQTVRAAILAWIDERAHIRSAESDT